MPLISLQIATLSIGCEKHVVTREKVSDRSASETALARCE